MTDFSVYFYVGERLVSGILQVDEDLTGEEITGLRSTIIKRVEVPDCV